MLTSILAFVTKLLHPVFHLFGVDVAPFFDPDTKIWSIDKLEHFLGVALLTWVGCVFLPNVTAAIVAVCGAALFELGQWDSVRTTAPTKLGTPGYGFGLLDLVAGAAGAGSIVVVLFLKHAGIL